MSPAAVNVGEDADTTGASHGQLAGVFHGDAAIPAEWLHKLNPRDAIPSIADGLAET